MAPLHQPLICSYTHLPTLPRPQHALHLLRKIASVVKPIMTARGFRIHALCEFYPAQPNLLGINVNHGEKICLRLRQPYDASSFLPIEDVYYTMLHELTHNVWGPHDERFYGLLKELENEFDALRARGWDGEGFYVEGKRLGAGAGRRVDLADARRRALAAAEKRAVLNRGSGQALGGSRPGAVPAREVLAAAAERRKKDATTCGAGNERAQQQAGENGVRTEAAEESELEKAIIASAVEFIEREERERGALLTGYYEPSPPPIPQRLFDGDNDNDRLSFPAPRPNEGDIDWACAACTLINPPLYLQCGVCGTPRSDNTVPDHVLSDTATSRQNQQVPPKAKGKTKLPPPSVKQKKMWACHVCTRRNEADWWTCQSCGVMKLSS